MGSDTRPEWLQRLGPRLTTIRNDLDDLRSQLDSLAKVESSLLFSKETPINMLINPTIPNTIQLVNEILSLVKVVKPDKYWQKAKLFPKFFKYKNEPRIDHILYDIKRDIRNSIGQTKVTQDGVTQFWDSLEQVNINEANHKLISYLSSLALDVMSNLTLVDMSLRELQRVLDEYD